MDKCPKCNSTSLKWIGYTRPSSTKPLRKKYYCKDCKKTFTGEE